MRRMLTLVMCAVGALSVCVPGVRLQGEQGSGQATQTAKPNQTPPQTAKPNQAPPPKQPAPPAQPPSTNGAPPPKGTLAPVTPPPDYIIGPEDILSIVYWREKDLTADVTVRPDGKISLPLLNDIQAAGLTPAQLRDRLTEESRRFVEDPNVSVVVHTINSRKVYITGDVGKPGPYPLVGPMTVLQLVAMAGGLGTYADTKKIVIVRMENGRQVFYQFNYHDAATGRSLKQNIELKPGDTVIVP